MTQVSSKLSVAGTDDPIVQASFVPRLAGVDIYLPRSDFNTGVTAERTRISSNSVGIYLPGQRIRVQGESPCYRSWFLGTGGSDAANAAASHARTVTVRPGLDITLAADSNVVFVAAGAPSAGTGANGDISVDYTGNVVYTKSGGTWSVTTSAIFSGSGGSTTVVDALNSTSTTSALSANQGKVLKDTADALATTVAGKQASLVSGTNIKTINGTSILGSGDLAVSGGSGAISYVNAVTSGKFLASQDNTGALPAAGSRVADSIDIQTARNSSVIVGNRDVLFGQNCGLTSASGGFNVFIQSAGTNGKSSTGNNVGIRGTFTGNPTGAGLGGFNTLINSSLIGGGNYNTVVGYNSSLNFFVAGKDYTANNFTVIGSYHNINPDYSSSLSTAVMDVFTAVGSNISTYGDVSISLAIGNYNTIGQQDGTGLQIYRNSALIGNNLALINKESDFLRIGIGKEDSSAIAIIDLIAGSSINTSLVRLGSPGLDDYAGSPTGANVAISKAIAYEGKTIVASSATQVVVPDNCSHLILTGTTATPIKMPTNPIDGQIVVIAFDGAQTPASWAAFSGHTLRNSPSGAVPAGSSYEWIFNSSNNTWYRLR